MQVCIARGSMLCNSTLSPQKMYTDEDDASDSCDC